MAIIFPSTASLTLRLPVYGGQGYELSYNQMDLNWMQLRSVDGDIINVLTSSAFVNQPNTFTSPQIFPAGIFGNLTGTASFVTLKAGPGIVVNGTEVSCSITTNDFIASGWTGSTFNPLTASLYNYTASMNLWTGSVNLQTVTSRGNTTTSSVIFNNTVTIGDVDTTNYNLESAGQLFIKTNTNDASSNTGLVLQSGVSNGYDAQVFINGNSQTGPTSTIQLKTSVGGVLASRLTVTGDSVIAPKITGSLFGTASQAITASYVDIIGQNIIVRNNGSQIEITGSDTSNLLTTSSFNAWTGSTFNPFTGSVNNFTASTNLTTGSLHTYTASLNNWTSSVLTTSSFNAWTGSTTSFFAGIANTASFVDLTAGPGIIIDKINNPLTISASVLSVNGVFPVNGNIATSLTQTDTGTSASLAAFTSSTNPDGLVWIISGDPTPANNGDSYIWVSSSQQWVPISPLDTAAGDARYLKLDGSNGPMLGAVDFSGFQINGLGVGTASDDAINLGQLTASVNLLTGSINGVSQSFHTYSASLNNWTGSSASNFAGTAATASYVNIVGQNITVNRNGAEIQLTGSSVDGLLTTSSFNAWTGSTFNPFTGSVNAYTASLNNTTSSWVTTSSFNTLTSSYNTFTGSVNAYTASLNAVTSSWVTNTTFNTLSSSYNTFTGSLFDYTASLNNTTSSWVTTSSFGTYTASMNTWTGSGTSVFGGTSSANYHSSSINGTNLTLFRPNGTSDTYTVGGGSLAEFYAYSASLNNWTSSVTTTSSFNSLSASYDLFTGSVNAYTASLNNTTSSWVTTSSFGTYTASMNSWTGSSSSQFAGTSATASYVDIVGNGITVNYNGSQIQLTGSGGGNLSEFYAYSASLNNTTSSWVTTSSFGAYTASVNSWTGSTTSQFAGTASKATTASYVDIVGKDIVVNYNGSQIQLTGSNVSGFLTTSSFNAWTGSTYNVFTGSIFDYTASLNNVTSSWVTTTSFGTYTASMNNWTGSSSSQFAGTSATASYVEIVGDGITVNYNSPIIELTASVKSVNGIFPVNGNIATSLTQTDTGTDAARLAAGGASTPDGLVWIVSGDPTPANNGDSYIWVSGSQTWEPISSLDTAAADARYLKLDGSNSPMQGNVNWGSYQITNLGEGTLSSDAINLGQLTASVNLLTGSINNVSQSFHTYSASLNSWTGSNTSFFAGTASNADTASYYKETQNLQDVTTIGNQTSASLGITGSVSIHDVGSSVTGRFSLENGGLTVNVDSTGDQLQLTNYGTKVTLDNNTGQTTLEGAPVAIVVDTLTPTPNQNSVLDLQSIAGNPRGFLPPRMSELDRLTNLTPLLSVTDVGLIVYQTNTLTDPEGLYIWKSTGWVQII